MRLKIIKVDGRCRSADGRFDVTDMDSGKNVGFVLHRLGSAIEDAHCPSWSISLFDGKYAGNFKGFEECTAFAAGVEAVLSHMTSTSDKRPKQKSESTA
jgi:hypothetical protein